MNDKQQSLQTCSDVYLQFERRKNMWHFTGNNKSPPPQKHHNFKSLSSPYFKRYCSLEREKERESSIADDVLRYASDSRLTRWAYYSLEAAKGLKFISDRIQYKDNWMPPSGLKEGPKKVEAIKEISPPTCCKDLERLQGMVNYQQRFSNKWGWASCMTTKTCCGAGGTKY